MELSIVKLHEIALHFLEVFEKESSERYDASILPLFQLVYSNDAERIEKYVKKGNANALRRKIAEFEDRSIDIRESSMQQLAHELYLKHKFILGKNIFEKVLNRTIKKGKIKDFNDYGYLLKFRKAYDGIADLYSFYSQADPFLTEYLSRKNSTGKGAVEQSPKSNPIRINIGGTFPFEILDGEEDICISLSPAHPELYPRYYEMLQRHGYEGNGYCWEGHIVQILEQKDPALLNAISFEAEGGTLFLEFDHEHNRNYFFSLLCPILSDIDTFEKWVAKADHSRIDD